MNLKQYITGFPDFPKQGIYFYDISTLLAHPQAWQATVELLAEKIQPHRPDMLAGIESRGFLLAAPIALTLGIGFTMIRKKGKLPGTTISHEYDLEYGSDMIEIQDAAVPLNSRVMILDDVLATGGTMAASIELLRKSNAQIAGAACIIQLEFLKGRQKLGGVPFCSLVNYDS